MFVVGFLCLEWHFLGCCILFVVKVFELYSFLCVLVFVAVSMILQVLFWGFGRVWSSNEVYSLFGCVECFI